MTDPPYCQFSDRRADQPPRVPSPTGERPVGVLAETRMILLVPNELCIPSGRV
jgi:hypothetical protein